MTPNVNVAPPIGKVNRRRVTGISLIEVVISLFIFLMMALMVAIVLPVATRNTRYSNTYGQAVALCQRKIDQVQEAGWSKLNAADLLSLGIIDNSTPVTVTGGTVYSFSNNNGTNTASKSFDNLRDFFPGGTAVTGTIRIEELNDEFLLGNVNVSNTMQPVMQKVTVTINWREAVGPAQSFSMTALISQVSME